jgi:hypothetical protein
MTGKLIGKKYTYLLIFNNLLTWEHHKLKNEYSKNIKPSALTYNLSKGMVG